MTSKIALSLLTISSLYASEVELSKINIESTLITEVAQNAQTSADVAQALTANVPSIDMSRRSAIANDILIRGQKRDNITVEVDGTKVYGACPNRMDPPVSHILANQIEEIEVIEGPYDVETFGTLSGGLKIQTKRPSKELKGEINLGAGSFNYKKLGASASGGDDFIRLSIAASMESSDQYRDGNGDTIATQIDKNAAANPTNPKAQGAKFLPQYHDMPAYDKKSIMAKAFITTLKDHELRLGVTANRSNNIIYGNSPMDAIYDDSNIYNVEYHINNISDNFENVNLQYYHSDVDHPMGTDYRVSSNTATMTNWLTTSMDGLKLKNNFNFLGHMLLVGLDTSERKWDGHYERNSNPNYVPGGKKSIDESVTNNSAIFLKLDKSYKNLDVSIGARYDATKITSAAYQDNDYTSFGANILSTYNLNRDNKIFFGFGQASRVPDARELYFYSSMNKLVGTPTLDQVTNQEFDLGYETDNDNFKFKIKAFYSMLENYIYFNKSLTQNNFENINATIFGAELSASIYATDELTFDLGASYKQGEKEKAMSGQTGTNLADMAPLRGNIAANYEYMNNSLATLEVAVSDKWDRVDTENGEQELDAWSIVNAKVKHAVNKKFDFTLGVNNLFNEAYAQSNTYADLTLVTAGTYNMLLNEPGRYIYTNLDFKF